jgi:hypothetical protein
MINNLILGSTSHELSNLCLVSKSKRDGMTRKADYDNSPQIHGSGI